jgi:hypothetical protein
MTDFSPGAVIGRSFAVWGRNLVAFSAAALAVQSPSIALAALWAARAPAGATPPRTLSLLSTLLGVIATGALTTGVLRALAARRARVGEMLRDGFRRMWNVLRVGIVGQLAVLIGLVLLVAPGLVFAAGLWVAVPAAVAERWKGTSDALTRSWELTKGRRWKVLAVALVSVVLALGGGLVAALLLETAVEWGANPSVVAALEEAIAALAGGFIAIASAVSYHDLRAIREGMGSAELAAVFE